MSFAKEDSFDAIVIGAGPGGLVAAGGLASLGARVALVEKSRMGGDCLNFGCVPSKALLRAGRAAAEVRRAERFGVDAACTVDLGRVFERVRATRREIAPHDSPERFEAMGVRVFLGEAAVFVTGREIRVGKRLLRGDRFVVATGGRAVVPPVPGLAEAPHHTNETLFDSFDPTTRSILVLGGGPIGCEMGQALARLGVRVTLLQSAPQILSKEDPDAARIVLASLREDGVEALVGWTARRVDRTEGGAVRVWATPTNSAQGRFIEADAILVAAGRRPNVEGLGLEAAGVSTGGRGIVVDDCLRTTERRIYAVGDVLGGPQFTHYADAQARTVVRNIAFPWWPSRFDGRVVPRCTFTSPEVASVGCTEKEVRVRDARAEVFRFDLSGLDRAVCDGASRGFVKVLADRSGRILGATAVGPSVGDWIHEYALAMKEGVGLGKISGTIHAYPTYGEAARRPADSFLRARFGSVARTLLAPRWR